MYLYTYYVCVGVCVCVSASGINGRDFSTAGHQRVSNLHHALQTSAQLNPNTYYIAVSPIPAAAPPKRAIADVYIYMYVDRGAETCTH